MKGQAVIAIDIVQVGQVKFAAQVIFVGLRLACPGVREGDRAGAASSLRCRRRPVSGLPSLATICVLNISIGEHGASGADIAAKVSSGGESSLA